MRRDGYALDNEVPARACCAPRCRFRRRGGKRSNLCVAVQAPVVRLTADKALAAARAGAAAPPPPLAAIERPGVSAPRRARERTVTDPSRHAPTARCPCANSSASTPTTAKVPRSAERDAHVPGGSTGLSLQPDVTLAHPRRLRPQPARAGAGLHGTGKSTHVEQVAGAPELACVRVNLDGHISRLDLVGRDAVVLRDGQQVTEFQEGIVPWALQRRWRWCSTKYDAGPARRDVRDPAHPGARASSR